MIHSQQHPQSCSHPVRTKALCHWRTRTLSRVVFTQLLQAGAVDDVQIGSYRLTGVREALAVLLATKFLARPYARTPVVWDCEYIFD
jgi:hypothetical protein